MSNLVPAGGASLIWMKSLLNTKAEVMGAPPLAEGGLSSSIPSLQDTVCITLNQCPDQICLLNDKEKNFCLNAFSSSEATNISLKVAPGCVLNKFYHFKK